MRIIEMICVWKQWGGMEEHVKTLTKGLKARGHEVVVVTRPVEHLASRFAEITETVTVPMKNAVDLATIWQLVQLIRNKKVDIVHAHSSREAWLGLFAVMLAGRGKVVTTRHVPLAAKADAIHAWFYGKLARIFCVSQFVKDKVLSRNGVQDTEKVRVIYPGIDFRRLTCPETTLRQKLGVNEKSFLVGFVGRVTTEKGVADLVEAVGRLQQQSLDCCLAIVGLVNPETPEYFDELKALCQKWQIEQHVIFCGFSDHMAEVMYGLDLLVLPSRGSETFGLVLGEALYCGTPVITTSSGAQSEIVRNGVDGIVVPPGDPEQLAEALRTIMTQPNLGKQMGQNGQKRVQEEFGLDTMIDRIEQEFKQIL